MNFICWPHSWPETSIKFQTDSECNLITRNDLFKVQDIAWSGLVDFFENDGFEEDKWGGTVTVPAYHEYNVSTQSDGVVIYEPCNYASNVAYYHDATEMCNNAGQLSMSR